MKKRLHNFKFLTVLFVLFFGAQGIYAQSMANYSGTNYAASSGSFTPLTGATAVPTLLADDVISSAIPIGFDFYYMGTSYTQLQAGSDGYITLATTSASTFTNNLATGTTVTRPVIAPFWDDMDGRGTGASASYLTSGTIGSRIFTFQWLNWVRTGGSSPVMSFQVKLYEDTGRIQFVYRSEGTALSGAGASIGLSGISTGSGNYVSLNGAGASPTSSTTSETTNISAKPATGQIYTFTPLALTAPTGLSFTNVGVTGMTLNWTDNATGEIGYVIYYSTDNVNFTYLGQIAANSTGANVSGFSPGTLYYWKVYALREALSTALSGSQATRGGVVYTTNGSFTVPCYVTSLKVEAWGGGGKGGDRTSGNNVALAGGGGGAYSSSTLTSFSSPYTITVGAGSINTSPGGDSSFGSSVIAKGGGSVADNSNTRATGGLASASVGTIRFNGGTGAAGVGGTYGGGGGSSAGSAVAGNFTNATTTQNAGAVAPLNGGNGGTGAVSGVAGVNGTFPGGGGGGGYRAGNGTTQVAGDGGNGQVVVSWTCPSATIAYSGGPFCKSLTSATVTITGTDARSTCSNTFSSTPAGLSINATTGAINPSLSTAGTYTVSYQLASAGGCTAVNATASVTINALPVVTAGSQVCIGSTITLSPTSGGTWTSSNANATVTNAGVVTGVTTGTATFTFTNTTTNCSATTSSVTINPVLTPSVAISITTGANPTCNGTSITFTATPTNGGTPTYQWTKNGSNISGANSVTYTGVAGTAFVDGDLIRVVMTSTATCASPTTATSSAITITVNTLSTAPTGVTGTLNICNGSSTTLTLSGGSAGTGAIAQWYAVSCGAVPGDTGTSITVSPSTTTTYYVLYTGTCNTTTCASATVTLTSTSSSDGVSWSNGSPSGTKDAILTGASPIVLGADLNACSLTVNGPAVSVASGFNVDLNGAIKVTSGSFTLNNNSNLIQHNSNYTNSGNIVVHRNSAAIKRLDYTLWSSPVTGQELYAFSPLTFANRYYTYNSSTDQYNAFSGFAITGQDGNGVGGTDGNHAEFSTGTGYLIRAPWNHPTAPAVFAGTFTGIPNNGPVTIGTTSGLYYAIGNPYPSTIDADEFITNNSIGDNPSTPGDGLYFWRKTNNSASASYATYTTAGGVASGGDTSLVPIVPSGVIQVGEGFIVKATLGSIEFNNGQRIADNNNQFLRSTSIIERNRIWLNLSNATAKINQMMVSYMTGATQSVDPAIDGRYFNDNPTALNSLINNEEFAIQGRSLPFNSSDIVPLAFKAAAAGNYTIAIDHVDGLFTGGAQSIYLKDNLLNTYHDFATGAYDFASATGTFNSRFEIVFQSQLAIPTFTANTVVIYNQNNEFVVNSGNTIMSSIKVFDIRGRLIEEKKGINASQTSISGGLTNQVLLVQITSEDGAIVTKKVIK